MKSLWLAWGKSKKGCPPVLFVQVCAFKYFGSVLPLQNPFYETHPLISSKQKPNKWGTHSVGEGWRRDYFINWNEPGQPYNSPALIQQSQGSQKSSAYTHNHSEGTKSCQCSTASVVHKFPGSSLKLNYWGRESEWAYQEGRCPTAPPEVSSLSKCCLAW